MKTTQRRKRVIILSCLILLAAAPVFAADVRSGARVHIPAGTSVEGDLYAAANEVTVDGVIHGDLLATGSSIVIRGRVDGSVMAAGGEVVAEGSVGRAVRAAGRDVRLRGEVGSDAMLACGSCLIGEGARVGADVLATGGMLDLGGRVAGGVQAAGDQVRLAGASTNEVRVRANRLTVAASAVAPSLIYGAREPASVAAAARVPHIDRRDDWAPRQPGRASGAVGAALVALLSGLVLLWLWPRRAAELTRLIEERPGAALGFGLVAAAAVPLAVVLGLVTVVLSPLALMATAGYLSALYIGYLAGALLLGDLLLRRTRPAAHPGLRLLLGLGCLLVASVIPGLGPLISLLVTLCGFGGLVLLLGSSRWYNERFHPHVAPAA